MAKDIWMVWYGMYGTSIIIYLVQYTGIPSIYSTGMAMNIIEIDTTIKRGVFYIAISRNIDTHQLPGTVPQ